MRGTVIAFSIVGGTAVAAGCALPRCPNQPLQVYDPKAGYRLRHLEKGRGNTDDVFICLCFSGGGTRAAALSYGVLQGLHATRIPGEESDPARGRTLLDEVDAVSAVSGGSFTAMAYGLDREGVFHTKYEQRFLKRNIQTRLVRMVTRPINLLRLPLAMLDRIDVVAFYYNKDLFNRRTYADLAQPKTRPYIVINATNMALGERFEFTQDDFDVLGSDLSTVPVGHAVAASSAFPMLLSPMRLRYYPSPPGSDLYTRLSDPDGARENPRHYAWASSLLPRADAGSERERRLDEENHKYIHLLDGGITDNLGVTFLIQELRFGYIRELIETGKVKKLVVVVVDAGTDRPEPIESMANSPGLFRMALSTGNTGIKNYSSAMTQILRFMMREEPARRRENYKQCTDSIAQSCPQAQRPPRPAALDAEYYLIEVNFREIEDQKERERFLEMPTSFFLRSSQVDALIAQGGQLLADSADYRRLIADLGGALPERCGQCLRAKAPGSSCETCRVPD